MTVLLDCPWDELQRHADGGLDSTLGSAPDQLHKGSRRTCLIHSGGDRFPAKRSTIARGGYVPARLARSSAPHHCVAALRSKVSCALSPCAVRSQCSCSISAASALYPRAYHVRFLIPSRATSSLSPIRSASVIQRDLAIGQRPSFVTPPASRRSPRRNAAQERRAGVFVRRTRAEIVNHAK